jgi:hypothetical protein
MPIRRTANYSSMVMKLYRAYHAFFYRLNYSLHPAKIGGRISLFIYVTNWLFDKYIKYLSNNSKITEYQLVIPIPPFFYSLNKLF